MIRWAVAACSASAEIGRGSVLKAPQEATSASMSASGFTGYSKLTLPWIRWPVSPAIHSMKRSAPSGFPDVATMPAPEMLTCWPRSPWLRKTSRIESAQSFCSGLASLVFIAP